MNVQNTGKRIVLLGTCLFFLLAGFALFLDTAFAAEEGGGGGGKITVWQTLSSAGVVGLIILAISIAAVALIITFFIHIRRDELVPPDLLEHISELFDNDSFDEALEVCEENPSWLSTVMVAGLRRIDSGYEEIEKSMREASEEEEGKLSQRIGYLNLIANIAPMLGLFGTVYGMIVAFNKIAGSEQQPSPAELAGGISMALVTTLLGLAVAIPVMCFYTFFRNQVMNANDEIGNISEELMERFRK